MKKVIVYLIVLLVYSFSADAQDIINNPGTQTNEAIQQISAPGFNDIMSFQTLNQRMGNYANTQQVGTQNRISVNQKADAGTGISNQTFSIQEGNYNEMTVGQAGSGNLILGFQLGYLSNLFSFNHDHSFNTFLDGSGMTSGNTNEANAIQTMGEGNKMQVTQQGNHNGIVALQQGSGNSITASQKGSNNYMAIIQKGMNNSVSDYMQENAGGTSLYESILQVGNNLRLNTTGISASKPVGNEFSQMGNDLSIAINNELVNSLGGIKVNQTGQDMNIVVDQSYFITPMR